MLKPCRSVCSKRKELKRQKKWKRIFCFLNFKRDSLFLSLSLSFFLSFFSNSLYLLHLFSFTSSITHSQPYFLSYTLSLSLSLSLSPMYLHAVSHINTHICTSSELTLSLPLTVFLLSFSHNFSLFLCIKTMRLQPPVPFALQKAFSCFSFIESHRRLASRSAVQIFRFLTSLSCFLRTRARSRPRMPDLLLPGVAEAATETKAATSKWEGETRFGVRFLS